MHHPPFATQIAFMDEIGLSNPEALAPIIGKNAQVERILCGHLHRPIQARFAGALACTAPSTAHHITLDLAADAPPTFMLEPPAYYLHAWRAGEPLVTHTVYVGDFPGPYSF
jgi:3',5'-cyclic AMP phosphodiesterase CpdA